MIPLLQVLCYNAGQERFFKRLVTPTARVYILSREYYELLMTLRTIFITNKVSHTASNLFVIVGGRDHIIIAYYIFYCIYF